MAEIDWATEIRSGDGGIGVLGMDAILSQAQRGHAAAVWDAVAAEPALLQQCSGGHHRSLVWSAARGGHADLVGDLLDAGAVASIPGRIRAQIQVVLSPLAIAERYRKPAVADRLRQAGATLEPAAYWYLGHTHDALDALAHDPGLVSRELAADPVWRVTCLHYAVAGGQVELVDALVAHGAAVAPYTRLLLNITARLKRVPVREAMLARLIAGGIEQSLLSRWYQHQV